MQAARELPAPGQHLVKIVNVLGYLHNFREYTGPRACMELEILEGPDAGKILVDNISLSHPLESKGLLHRRVRIGCRLGLIPWGSKETVQVNWKSLEGLTCWVDIVHKEFKGHKYTMVDNYQLHSTT